MALPSTLNRWEDDLKKWPQITYMGIFSFLINSVGTDSEAVNNLKSYQYQYLHSKKVVHVLLKEVGYMACPQKWPWPCRCSPRSDEHTPVKL